MKKPTSRRRAEVRQPLNPPAGGVSIRMYRQGLGDCLLLAFGRDQQKPFYMLIDCGVLLNTPGSAAKMTEVVEDIVSTTERHIDLMVLTHEHWDHLSGFVEAERSFEKLRSRIGELWLGWTENPENDDAQQLQADLQRRASALKSFADKHRRMPGLASSVARVDALLGFHGLGAKRAAAGTSDALRIARALFGKKPRYCRPGRKPIEIADLPGVRFFILGPPTNAKWIRKCRPSAARPETYHRFDRLEITAESAFFAAALDGADRGLFADHDEAQRLSYPFDASAAISQSDVLEPGRLRSADAISAAARYLRARYLARGTKWRTIENDWLDAAGALALDLDHRTNNTSLAIAIELSDRGKVLLFPGDAQVGSWLSWHDLPHWKYRTDGGPRKFGIADVLARTVFYKVGHHGSHNATLKDKGLKLMTSSELTAMIPVDEKMAKDTKHWPMPFAPLLRDLKHRTQGRIMQIAVKRGLAGPAASAPAGTSPAEWKRFMKSVREDPLFWQLDLESD